MCVTQSFSSCPCLIESFIKDPEYDKSIVINLVLGLFHEIFWNVSMIAYECIHAYCIKAIGDESIQYDVCLCGCAFELSSSRYSQLLMHCEWKIIQNYVI